MYIFLIFYTAMYTYSNFHDFAVDCDGLEISFISSQSVQNVSRYFRLNQSGGPTN